MRSRTLRSTGTVDRARLALVLELHQRAYQLWTWIASEALHDPALLSRDAELAIADPARCASWLADLGERVPAALVVAPEHHGAYAALVSSFLHTSFHVQRLEWNGRVVDAQVRRGPGHPGARAARRARHGGSAVREALHRIARDEALHVSPRALRAVERGAAPDDLTLWTYAIGLIRRSEGRGEGEDDWRRYRAIDPAHRRALEIDHVWAARERLVTQLRRSSQPE